MTSPSESIALKIEDVEFGYRDRVILDRVSLSVRSGESLAVIGTSGSGKSTLLSCILGLVRPRNGVIEVDGEPVNQRTAVRLRRQKLGMVFQGGELLPELTPTENVIIAGLLGGLSSAVARQRATDLLDQLGVPPGDRLVGQFSGGEQQRVAVARALINRPLLLLADEPTGSLDPQTRDRVVELLHDLPRQFGCAMVLVSHDPVVAEACTRVTRLAAGHLTDVELSHT